MEFVAAKCPNCAGDLRLPDDRKRVKCMYCGFDIVVREAISAVGVNIDNWIKLATDAEQTGNYIEAYEYFTRILEFEPNNPTALLGKGIAAGQLSTSTRFRSEELLKGVNDAINNAPEQEMPEMKVHAARKIYEVCQAFKRDHSSDESKLQSYDVAAALEVAHGFVPDDENILSALYFQHRFILIDNEAAAATSRLLRNPRTELIFNTRIAEEKRYIEDCLTKLEALNPESAASLRSSASKMAHSGPGCLIMIPTALLAVLCLVFLFA